MAFPTLTPGSILQCVGSSMQASNVQWFLPGSPNVHLPDLIGSNPAGLGGLLANCGLGYDSVRRRLTNIAGGGDGDGGDNGIQSLDLEKLDMASGAPWRQDRPPTYGTSQSTNIIPIKGTYPSGLYPGVYTDTLGTFNWSDNGNYPAARHRYGGLVFMEPCPQFPNGMFWMATGIIWADSSQSNQVWWIDPVSYTFKQQINDLAPVSAGIAAAWDSKLRCVVLRGRTGVWLYDPSLTAGSRFIDMTTNEGDAGTGKVEMGVFDRMRRVFNVFGANGLMEGGTGIRQYSFLGAPTGQKTGVSLHLTGPGAPSNFGLNMEIYDSLTHDTLRDVFVWWPGGARMVEIYPTPRGGHPAGYCNLITMGGADPGVFNGNGILDKMVYLEYYDAYALVKDAGSDVYLFSHPDSGPSYQMPNQTTVGIPYPIAPEGASPPPYHSPLYAFQGTKHTRSIADPKTGRMYINAGDGVRIGPNGYKESLDSKGTLGWLDLKPTPTYGFKDNYFVPTAEWVTDRMDDCGLTFVDNDGAYPFDRKVVMFPGFGDAQGNDPSTTFDGLGDTLEMVAPGFLSGAVKVYAGDLVATLIVEQSFNGGSTYEQINFFNYDLGVIQSTFVTTPVTYPLYLYRSVIPVPNATGWCDRWRIRVSNYTSGSAVVQVTQSNLEDYTYRKGNPNFGVGCHGKPLPYGETTYYDPVTNLWAPPTGWPTPRAGDGKADGRGFYDKETNTYYTMGVSSSPNAQLLGFNFTTHLADYVLNLPDSLFGGMFNVGRCHLAWDPTQRVAYWIASDTPGGGFLTRNRIAYIHLPTGASGFMPNSDIPNYTGSWGGGSITFDWDTRNRCLIIFQLSDFGAVVPRISVYHPDVPGGRWEEFSCVSADFPGGDTIGNFVQANDGAYNPYYNLYFGWGGNGAGPLPSGLDDIRAGGTKTVLWRYAGGPTIATLTPSTLPSLSSISPSSCGVGAPQFTLTVNGSNFTAGGTVNWNGNALSTNFVNSGQYTATVPASLLLAAGTFTVSVTTPSPGGSSTNTKPFNVQAAAATATLAFNGKIRDRVGQGGNLLGPDNQLDGVCTCTVFGLSGRTITQLRLDSVNQFGQTVGTWSTQNQIFWVCGAALSLDGAYLNSASTMAVNFAVADGGTFNTFTADLNNLEYVVGNTLTLVLTLSDGSTATATATITPPAVPSGPMKFRYRRI